MSFGQGLSGLNAASQNLNVIGNNIANASTVGFKSSTALFADVYASSRVGLGVQVAAVSQNFTSGNINATGNELDLAIDGEKGFFRLINDQGEVVYSRNGQFHENEDGFIVNAQGYRLTGYGAHGTQLNPIQVPSANIAPRATTNVYTQANLDANAPVISETGQAQVLGEVTLTDTATNTTQTYYYRVLSSGDISWVDAAGANTTPPADGNYTSGAGVTVTLNGGQIQSGSLDTSPPNVAYEPAIVAKPFNPTDSSTYTHSLPITVFDSLGNDHQLTQYFVKREGVAGTQSQWDVYYYLDGQPVDTPAGGGPSSMTFSNTGLLTSPPVVNLSFNDPGSSASPAEPLVIALDYAGSTQFGGPFAPSFNQNGYETGEYIGILVETNGDIVANYSNGHTQQIGSVALASFRNNQGLKPVGDNAWIESPSSGQPIVGKPGANGLATLKGQAIEESNVDMSQELVSMMIAQRVYQANSQTIKTQDQIMQTLISMR